MHAHSGLSVLVKQFKSRHVTSNDTEFCQPKISKCRTGKIEYDETVKVIVFFTKYNEKIVSWTFY